MRIAAYNPCTLETAYKSSSGGLLATTFLKTEDLVKAVWSYFQLSAAETWVETWQLLDGSSLLRQTRQWCSCWITTVSGGIKTITTNLLSPVLVIYVSQWHTIKHRWKLHWYLILTLSRWNISTNLVNNYFQRFHHLCCSVLLQRSN